MNRSQEVASRMADRLFDNRRGHGSTERIVERHLRRGELEEIIKAAYDIGWNDGLASAGPGGMGEDEKVKHIMEVLKRVETGERKA